MRFRVVLSCPNGPWYQEAIREIQREKYFHDDIDLEIVPVQNVDQQIRDLLDLKTKKIDLLIVSPIFGSNLTPIVEDLYASGVPVVLYDRKINSEQYTAFVAADNFEIGRQMGEYVKSMFPAGGNIFLLRGTHFVSADEERYNGFISAIRPGG